MLPLILDKTDDTLEIILDKKGKYFTFSGNSIPENTNSFFQPVLEWIEGYINDPNEETIVNFKMEYFNTSSSKSIFDILEKLVILSKEGKMLIINWYFTEEIDDTKDELKKEDQEEEEEENEMLEAGEGYSKMLRFPFNYIKY